MAKILPADGGTCLNCVHGYKEPLTNDLECHFWPPKMEVSQGMNDKGQPVGIVYNAWRRLTTPVKCGQYALSPGYKPFGAP